MSSTLRGKEREVSDYYATPVEDVRLFLSNFLKYESLGEDIKILDPCAGGHDSYPMSYPTVLNEFGFKNILTVDIREDSKATLKGDYLTMQKVYDFDMIITNPPFSLAIEIIKKALSEVSEGGFVIMLQRLNFWGSKSRFEFFKNNMPKYCFIHHKRIKFINKNGLSGTDSIEYAHFVWQKEKLFKETKTILI